MKHSRTQAPHAVQAAASVVTVTPGTGMIDACISAGRYLADPRIVQQQRQQKQTVRSLPRFATPHI